MKIDRVNFDTEWRKFEIKILARGKPLASTASGLRTIAMPWAELREKPLSYQPSGERKKEKGFTRTRL